MKSAFAHWENRIAPVFDVARQLYLVETRSGEVVSETREMLDGELSVQKVLRLKGLGVEQLVCGAISNTMRILVSAYDIRVIPFVTGELGEVIRAWFGR